MLFLQAWLLFPLVLVLLSLGGGLLLARVAGDALPSVLVLPTGFALLVVVASLATYADATAELAAPLLVVVAVAGFVVGRHRLRGLRGRARDALWPAVAGLLPAAAIAAPVVLTGRAGFTGYGRIVDGAFQLDYSQWLQRAGQSPTHASDSSFLLIAQKFVDILYPAGTQAALGATSRLAATDPIWTWQPFIAAFGAVLGVSLYVLLERAIPSRRTRALAAGIAAQPTILYAYGIVAGIKEVSAAALLVLAMALLAVHRPGDGPWRQVLPASVAIAGLYAVFNIGILPWIGIGAGVLFLVEVIPRRAARGRVIAHWAAMVVLAGVLTFPALIASTKLAAIAAGGGPQELGNLAAPIPAWSAAGIWLTQDHRFPLSVSGAPTPTYVLIAVALAFAALGLLRAAVNRDWSLIALGAAGAIGLLYVVPRTAPWSDLKAYIITAPITLSLAFAGAVSLWPAVRARSSAAVIGMAGAVAAFALIGGGVLVGNALEYHSAALAPSQRFAELQRIGERFAGKGPALLPSFEEYGEYLLRDAKGSSIVNPVGGITGLRPDATPGLQFARDIDEYTGDYLKRFRLIVRRRDPTASRPPSNWRLVRTGRFYEVWQKTASPVVVAHLPLRSGVRKRPARYCAALSRGLRRAGPGARVSYRTVPPLVQFAPDPRTAPSGWIRNGPGYIATGPGRLASVIELPTDTNYRLWLQGSVGRTVRVSVDGRVVSNVRWQEGYPGGWDALGTVPLRAGRHRVEIFRGGGRSLLPGTGNDVGSSQTLGSIGALLFEPPSRSTVRTVTPAAGMAACRGRAALDWMEIVRPRG
jgi:hypothetical protein